MTGTIYLNAFANGRNYVGQTWDLESRQKNHKQSARAGKHHNEFYQRCYDKYGMPKQEILVSGIETQSELDRLETLWTWRLSAHVSVGGIALQLPGRGGRHSEGTKRKIGDAQRGSKHTAEAKEKMSKAARQNVKDGEHHMLGGEIARQLVKDGKHNFLGGELQRQRVKNGTHHFLGGEISGKVSRQRVLDGTHNFLGYDGQCGTYYAKLAFKDRRRKLYQIYATLLTSRTVLLEYRHRQLQREGFYDKEIPDTTNATQLTLFERG